MATSKKILILYQDWEDRFLNKFEIISDWCQKRDGISFKENDIYFLALSNINKEINLQNNIKIRLIKSFPNLQFFYLNKFKKILKQITSEFKPDFIYTPFVYLNSLVPKSDNYKIITFVREKTPESVKAKGGLKIIASYIFHILDFLSLRKTDIIFHNGKNMLDYSKTHGFKGQSFYAPRPILDIDLYNKENSKKIIEKYKLQNKKIILTVARLTKEKNIELGIKALKLLPDNYVYLILGEGDEKGRLIDLAKKERVNEIVFFIGFVEHKKLWPYYKAADIFWLLSKTDFEGTPNVLQEALYSQVPCIVSKIPAMKNIIEDKSNGFILESWNPEELSKKTEYLLNKKEIYKKFQINGVNKIKEILKRYIKIEDILNKITK